MSELKFVVADRGHRILLAPRFPTAVNPALLIYVSTGKNPPYCILMGMQDIFFIKISEFSKAEVRHSVC